MEYIAPRRDKRIARSDAINEGLAPRVSAEIGSKPASLALENADVQIELPGSAQLGED